MLKEGGGLFSKFEWVHDPYGADKVLITEEKKHREAKVIDMHEKHFNPAQVKKNLVFDYPFLGRNEKSTYAFLSAGDPYEIVKEEKMRNRWVEEAKLLYGDFVPAGLKKPIQTIERS